MLLGFAVVSPFGGEPWWVSLRSLPSCCGVGTVVGLAGPHLVRAAHPGFAMWVLTLGVVVAGPPRGFLGDVVRDLAPESVSLGGPVGSP